MFVFRFVTFNKEIKQKDVIFSFFLAFQKIFLNFFPVLYHLNKVSVIAYKAQRH